MSQLKLYSPVSGPDFLATNFGRLRTARAKYDFSVDGGAIATITPKTNETVPDNAIMLACFINPIVALLAAGGAANVSVGLSAGSTGVAALLAATAKASFSIDALLVGVPVPATPVKMTAAGLITLTPDTHALTAGVCEVVVVYYQASA